MKQRPIFFVCLISLVLPSLWLEGNDALLWSFETGDRVVAEPVIRNDSLFIGSLDSNFYVLDAATGAELWRYNTDNQIRTTALLYEDIVCFESGNVLYGLGMDGSLLWTDTLYDGEVVNAHDTWDVFRSSPTLHDTIAYIGSEEGLVLGVNIKTGERVFEAQTPQADATIETPPAIYNDKVYVGDWLGVLSVFDIETGDLAWQYDTKDDNTYGWVNAIVAKPLIYRDTLYFGGRSCNLYALNPETGEKIWMYHHSNDQWLFGGPVVDNDTLYVGSSYQQKVFVFNPNEAELYWEADVFGLNYGNPATMDNYVLVGTGSTGGNASGSLSMVNKNTHELTGRFNVDGWVETPLYLDGIVYFGCGDGKIYAVDTEALLSIVRPETILKDGSDIDLGAMPAGGTVSTSFYLNNIGEGTDSITDISTNSRVDVQPGSFLLEPHDSAEVTVTIDLEGLSAGPRNFTVLLRSNRSMIPQSFSKRISLTIEEENGLTYSVMDAPFNIRLYPNPASTNAILEFHLEKPSFVQTVLYNEAGIMVKTIYQGYRPEGEQSLEFDTSSMKNGQYIYLLRAGGRSVSGALLVQDLY